MKFSHEDIKEIAELARLELSPEELFLYGKQLSEITDYIEKLQSVKISAIEKVSPPLKNVWREDKPEPWDLSENEEALEEADREAGLIKVKRVL
ncbi:MAG: Asp-tRNA(Asn)/Glu-tRNA(Gln) amidotransferase subunit GatC [Clostridia bacterium]|nr:Asp-tRNA(Asn)/Glu-tRNA(Gln) amidotransferase subunit GatC [Clostridia bacterium]